MWECEILGSELKRIAHLSSNGISAFACLSDHRIVGDEMFLAPRFVFGPDLDFRRRKQ
jgi:hypothetical protein